MSGKDDELKISIAEGTIKYKNNVFLHTQTKGATVIYKVVKIEEDIDFGCEEREDNAPIMAVVSLISTTGNTIVQKFPDDLLVTEDIQPGDQVVIDEAHTLRKVLKDDWTKNCTSKTVDIQKFVSKMQALKNGQEIEWRCPFCGEEVKRLEQEGGHTVIGCTSCDMRIELESN